MRKHYVGLALILVVFGLIGPSSGLAALPNPVTIHSRSHVYVRRGPTDLAPQDQFVEGWQVRSPSGRLIKAASQTVDSSGRLLVSGGFTGKDMVLKDFLRGTTVRKPMLEKNTSVTDDVYLQQQVRSAGWHLMRSNSSEPNLEVYEAIQPISDAIRRWTAPYFSDLEVDEIITGTTYDPSTRTVIKTETFAKGPNRLETLIKREELLFRKLVPSAAFPAELIE